MGIGLLLASAASGCLARIFVHPLDTIRSRLMVSTSKTASFNSVASTLLKSDGFRGLYRGFGISVTMQAPAIATFLTSYDWAKANISNPSTPYFTSTSPLVHLVSGLVAETVSAVFWVPMEVVKQRAQVRRGTLSAATSTTIVRDLLRHEGPRALFKGYGLTVGVFGPYSMLYFMAYERFKADAACFIFDDRHATNRLSTAAVAVCAGSAGGIAAACTTPLDVIKTRLQTQGDIVMGTDTGAASSSNGKTGTVASTRKLGNSSQQHQMYRSTWHAARSIAVQDGLSGFFRGMSARVLWIIPSTAITMSTFEFLKSYFHLQPKS